MEKLYQTVTSLYPHLPLCFHCHKSLYEVQVYAGFPCLHFLCFPCAASVSPVTCPVCSTELVYCDYVEVESTRNQLISSIDRCMSGQFTAFPSVFFLFYRFLSFFDPQITVNSAPVSISPSISTEKCPCGKTKRKNADCSCGYILRNRTKLCSLCHSAVCDCKTVRSATDLWSCAHCGYQYNGKTVKTCFKCGKTAEKPGIPTLF